MGSFQILVLVDFFRDNFEDKPDGTSMAKCLLFKVFRSMAKMFDEKGGSNGAE